MNPTTAHTFIRCGNEIYRGDSANQWRMLHRFETQKRARRWQRDQEKKRPGSVTVGAPPVQVTTQRINALKADYESRRVREIARLTREQARDQARHSPKSRPDSGLSGKTAQLAYVAPDRDGSSSSRGRSKKRAPSRNGKGTRANSGVS